MSYSYLDLHVVNSLSHCRDSLGSILHLLVLGGVFLLVGVVDDDGRQEVVMPSSLTSASTAERARNPGDEAVEGLEELDAGLAHRQHRHLVEVEHAEGDALAPA